MKIVLSLIVALVFIGNVDAGPFRNRGGGSGSCANGSCGSSIGNEVTFVPQSSFDSQVTGTWQSVCTNGVCTMQFVPNKQAKRVIVSGYIENGIFYQTVSNKAEAEPSIQEVAKTLKGNLPTPNCKCGCTVTGVCTCKDCDHPKMAWANIN